MNKYRYIGRAERVFPRLRPALVRPGDVVEAARNPHPYWFEFVKPPKPEPKPEPKPTPLPRANEEDAA